MLAISFLIFFLILALVLMAFECGFQKGTEWDGNSPKTNIKITSPKKDQRK